MYIYKNLNLSTETLSTRTSHKFFFISFSNNVSDNFRKTFVDLCSVILCLWDVFKLSLSTNIMHSRSTGMFSTIKTNLKEIGCYVVGMLLSTEQKYVSLNEASSYRLPIAGTLLPSNKDLHFMSPFWDLEISQCLQNGAKALLPGQASTGRQISVFPHRWSIRDAWQHIWLGCFWRNALHVS